MRTPVLLMIEEHDTRSRRCPMLGHPVNFSLCRTYCEGEPCRKIFDCWWEIFEIEPFIRNHFNAATIQRILSPPKDKTVSLFELILQARKRNKKKE